jgi:hypothetical protein
MAEISRNSAGSNPSNHSLVTRPDSITPHTSYLMYIISQSSAHPYIRSIGKKVDEAVQQLLFVHLIQVGHPLLIHLALSFPQLRCGRLILQ